MELYIYISRECLSRPFEEISEVEKVKRDYNIPDRLSFGEIQDYEKLVDVDGKGWEW